jgi:hypothetical protein
MCAQKAHKCLLKMGPNREDCRVGIEVRHIRENEYPMANALMSW